jgi:hypothetical protein
MRKALLCCFLLILQGSWACDGGSPDYPKDCEEELSESGHSFPLDADSFSHRVPYFSGQPVIDQYGRPRQFVPNDGGGGVPLGPITPNAYGPGMHMDATGRPARAAPWP